MKNLFFILAIVFSANAFAQTYQQKGVVRMITTTASSQATPVSGVSVIVGNNVSNPSGQNGGFSVNVTQQTFVVNGVADPEKEYILAIPTKGKSYYVSQNDLDVVVTTKTQKDADYKRLYADIKAKYDEQSDAVARLKRNLQRKVNELSDADAEYAKVKAELDSVQALYLDYINNEEKIDEEIKKIAESLSITDYQTLDSIEQRIYELKCAGEWKSISDLMHDVMHGDAESYIKEKKANKERATEARLAAEAQETAAERDFLAALSFFEESIESFKMQHLNDSVSRYYEILTDMAPENWEYLDQAGMFEDNIMGSYEAAIEYFQRAISLNVADTLTSNSYSNLGCVYESLEMHEQALECFDKALKLDESATGDKNERIASHYNSVGAVYESMGDYDKAIDYYEKALSYLSEKCLLYATCYANIGLIYFYKRDYEKSIAYQNESLAMVSSLLGEESLECAIRYINLGGVYEKMDEYDKALDYYQKALKIRLTNLNELHPNVALCYNNLGSLYNSMNEVDSAMVYYQKALDIRLLVYGPSHTSVARIYNNIGAMYYSVSDYDLAREYFYKALAIYEGKGNTSPLHIAIFYDNIASTYEYQNNFSEAIKYLNKALDIHVSVLGEDNIDVAMDRHKIGEIYYYMNEYDKSIECLEMALKHYEQDPQRNVRLIYPTQSFIGNVKYVRALSKQDKSFFDNKLLVTEVVPNGAASQRGMEGEYYILEFEEWNLEKLTSLNFYDITSVMSQ